MKESCIKNFIFLLIVILFFRFPLAVCAKENTVKIKGQYYRWSGQKNNYNIATAKPSKTTGNQDLVGELSVTGDFKETEGEQQEIPRFEVADGKLIEIKYSYTDRILNAGENDWHLEKESKKEVDGVQLGEKIGNATIILQTSFDGKKWVTINYTTDLIHKSGYKKYSKYNNCINSVQLNNKCHYRIIVAYKTSQKGKGIFNTSYRQNAEVYEFVAEYKKNDKKRSERGKKYFYAGIEKDEYTMRTKSNSYSLSEKVDVKDEKDPHYGWKLGYFVISGYSGVGDKGNTFLKTKDDEIELSFHLKQDDISRLNNNSDIFIAEDKKGFDKDFGEEPHNMGHGELIIKHITTENKPKDKVVYSNFLEALAYPGADTKICLFEEGSYEIHLNYAITNKKGIDKTTYYKTSFKFEIGNGNNKAFIKEVATNRELFSGEITQNGFYIDTAKSESLDISVKRDILYINESGSIIKDTRSNQISAEGKEYTEEGIYTITSTNRHKKDLNTESTIYVGNDKLLMACNKNPQYTLEELSELEKRKEIADNGEIVRSEDKTKITETTEMSSNESSIMDNTNFENQSDNGNSELPENQNKKTNIFIVLLIIGVIFVAVAIIKKKPI